MNKQDEFEKWINEQIKLLEKWQKYGHHYEPLDRSIFTLSIRWLRKAKRKYRELKRKGLI